MAQSEAGSNSFLNLVVASGRLSRPARETLLASGDRLVSLELTVPRDDGPAEGLPVVWPGAPVSAASLDVGEEVLVSGRVRRRFFRSGGATQSRTEVVAASVVRLRRARRARAVTAAAVATLQEVLAVQGGPDPGCSGNRRPGGG